MMSETHGPPPSASEHPNSRERDVLLCFTQIYTRTILRRLMVDTDLLFIYTLSHLQFQVFTLNHNHRKRNELCIDSLMPGNDQQQHILKGALGREKPRRVR